MKGKIILIGLMFLICVSSIYAYQLTFNENPNEFTWVNATLNNTEITFPVNSYNRYCEDYETNNYTALIEVNVSTENGTEIVYKNQTFKICSNESYLEWIDVWVNVTLDNWEDIREPEINNNIYIEGNIISDGYGYFKDGIVDGTEGIENISREEILSKIELIKNNPDGSLNDSTLPVRWQKEINGKIFRDISTMLSDFINAFEKIIRWSIQVDSKLDEIETHLINQNQRLNTIEQDLCNQGYIKYCE